MLALVKKHRVWIGLAVAAVALYYLLRDKPKAQTKVAAGGNVLDPSNDADLNKLFDQLNPGIKA